MSIVRLDQLEPPAPSWWERLTAHFRRAEPGDPSLVAAIETHARHVAGYAHHADLAGLPWLASGYRREADDLRRILRRHRP